jgi:hypothetical protein
MSEWRGSAADGRKEVAAEPLARRVVEMLGEALRELLCMVLVGIGVGLVGLVVGLIVGLATAPSSDPNAMVDDHSLWIAGSAVVGGGIGFAVGALGILGRDLWDRFGPELRR